MSYQNAGRGGFRRRLKPAGSQPEVAENDGSTGPESAFFAIEMNAVKKRLKPRIGPYRISDWFHCQINQAVVVLVHGSIEIEKRVVLVAEADGNDGQIQRGNVSLMRKGLELVENAKRRGAITGNRQRMAQHGEQRGIARRQGTSDAEMLQSLRIHFFLPVSGSQPEFAEQEVGRLLES